jgi:GTPase SAR1 family protein
VRYFTNSSAVLWMLDKDLASFLEFVSTWVSEIKTKSDPEKE